MINSQLVNVPKKKVTITLLLFTGPLEKSNDHFAVCYIPKKCNDYTSNNDGVVDSLPLKGPYRRFRMAESGIIGKTQGASYSKKNYAANSNGLGIESVRLLKTCKN